MFDTLIKGGHLLTMSGDGVGFVEQGAIAIDRGVIIAVGPKDDIVNRDTARRVMDIQGGIVMPGLVDAHLHSSATMGRGWAQEVSPWMASSYGPLMTHAI